MMAPREAAGDDVESSTEGSVAEVGDEEQGTSSDPHEMIDVTQTARSGGFEVHLVALAYGPWRRHREQEETPIATISYALRNPQRAAPERAAGGRRAG